METTAVYRIEHHESGRGPYDTLTFGQFAFKIGAAHSQNSHPSPRADAGIGDAFDSMIHHCGTGDYVSLKKWFAGWGKGLRELGFIVRKYAAPAETTVVSGVTGQAVFERGRAKCVAGFAIPFD